MHIYGFGELVEVFNTEINTRVIFQMCMPFILIEKLVPGKMYLF